MIHKLAVETRYCADLIEQRVVQETWNGAHEFAWHIINLRDQGVRDALIALGWTPPPTGQEQISPNA